MVKDGEVVAKWQMWRTHMGRGPEFESGIFLTIKFREDRIHFAILCITRNPQF